MQPQPSHPNHCRPPLHSPHFSSQCDSLHGPVFDHWIKRNIQSCTVQTICSSDCTHLARNNKYQYGMVFIYVQYIASNISSHYLNLGRQRAASPSAIRCEQGNSFWGSPTRIIHKGFNIKIFHSALALNNSCLAFVFIGIGSRGVIRH